MSIEKIQTWYKATSTATKDKTSWREKDLRQKKRDKVLKRAKTTIGTVRVVLCQNNASDDWIARMCEAIDKYGI